MLAEAYPEIRFEVVNAAVTAINSHVVREIAADCAKLEPDIFIVYEGNNEVIGPFGPSAALTPFLRSRAGIDALIALRRSRTGQLLRNLAHRLGRNDEALQQWAGMEMFLERQFPADHPALAEVRARFRENLESIITSGAGAGASTLLCSVLTNRKDFAPFLSAHRPDLSKSDLERWDSLVAAGNKAVAAGDHGTAEARYRAAAGIDDRHAALAFRLGRVLLTQEDFTGAAEWLERAETHDTLRFRTDASLNNTIAEVAGRSGDRARLVNLAPLAAKVHPSGIPGNELLYEHVHLDFEGAFLVAESLFAEVSAELVTRKRITVPVKQQINSREARLRLAYTAYEQAMIAQRLITRFKAPPFNGQFDHADRAHLWERRARGAEALLRKPTSKDGLIQLYQYARDKGPHDWVLARNSGMALTGIGEPAAALPLLRQAAKFINDDPDTLFALAITLRASDQNTEAAPVFARLRDLEPRFPGLPEE